MSRGCSGLLAMIIGWGLAAATGMAADASSSRNYGVGVHEFYRGQYFEAVRHFDLALGADSQDPRIYFFRGLAKQRLGWTGDARADFLMGSQLEVALKRRDIGMALQRIQGPDRLAIEQYRREARQLPEEIVRNVIPRPVTPLVQRPSTPRPGKASKAEYAVSDLPEDSSDPFRAEAPGLLGRGELQAVAEQPVAGQSGREADALRDDFGEQPFGSGVVAEAESDNQDQDPFALGDDEPGQAADESGAGAERTRSGGAVGAALRAFSRTIAPAATIGQQGEKLLDNLRDGNAAGRDGR